MRIEDLTASRENESKINKLMDKGRIALHLKHMESFELNVLRWVSQQIHHQLQVGRLRNVLCHDVKVRAIQQQLAQQLTE
jgi:hypothetical protein